jgi:large subunit ribosomal protein L16
MGSGKGAIDQYVAPVKPGFILFEVGGVSESIARSALNKAGHKLSVKTIFVKK